MHEQLNLFDPPCLTPRELGHVAAVIAADGQGYDWCKMAYDALVQYARQATAPFILKDVRDWATGRGLVPPVAEKRAWGAIALRAKRDGVIVCIGENEARHVHGSTVALWQAANGGEVRGE